MSAQVHFVTTGPATYADLEAVPAGYTAELVGGRLHALPRPKGKHIRCASHLGGTLVPPFDFGAGGPGGWWILDEPEIHWELNQVVTVPDLTGWRRDRLPEMPEDQRFTVIPDWLCEILSPATQDYDRNEKLPLYARYGVPFVWLVDPDAQWLEALQREGGAYRPVGRFGPGEAISAPPSEALAFHLF